MRNQTDPNFERERELFLKARERSSPAERAAFLDGACGADTALRVRLDNLLHNLTSDCFLARLELQAAPTQLVSVPILEGPGSVIGRYRLLQQIGEGGFGVVYVAEQKEPVKRRVALKIIKLGMDTKQVVARFEAERQALAMMDHPNIAKILDGGMTGEIQSADFSPQEASSAQKCGAETKAPAADESRRTELRGPIASGRPYFVMELVKGISMTKFCDQNHLSTQERLVLFAQVCHAIQHAHQKGIIHRDIKPSNVLVTLHDGKPVPKVIDFGIAKATQQELTEKTIFTQFQQMIGTPAYMSPEQAEMSGLDIDTRTDIYSLGVLLYELLTGKTPLDAKALLSGGYDEIRRRIKEEEPQRPSTRVSTMADQELTDNAGHRRADPKRFVAELRGDLDWIVMKALEKDRTRRYDNANELAEDIQRHLNDEAVIARPPSPAYRFGKLLRRNKLAFAAGSSVLLALLLGLGFATWQAAVATRARRLAETARAAESQERSNAISERNRAQVESARAERNAYAATMTAAQADWDNANISHLREILDETGSYPDKGFEWYYWQRLIRSELLSMRDHNAAVTGVCFSPDSLKVASGGRDRTVGIWDAASGQSLVKLRDHSGEVTSVAFSADSRRLLTVSNDGLVRISDTTSGKELQLFPGRAAALSPDGQVLLIASTDGLLRLMDSSSGRELGNLGKQESAVRIVAFSSDGTKILSAALGGSLRMWKWDRPSTPTVLWELPGPGWERLTDARPTAFSPDGQHLVTGGRDRIVRTLDANTGRELKSFSGHAEKVTAVAFSPDGRRIASGSLDRTIKVWDVDEGEARFTLRGHMGSVHSLAFAPNGQRLASASGDRTVKIWDPLNSAFPLVAGGVSRHRSFVRFSPTTPEARNWTTFSTNALQLVRWSPDGRRILTAAKDNTARIWDATTLAEIQALRGHTFPLSHANYSPDGTFITTGSYDRSLRLWNASTGKELRVWHEPHEVPLWSRMTRDGQQLLSATKNGFIRIWDMAGDKELLQWKAHEGGTWTAEYSPDEQRIASCGAGGVVKVWNARTGEQLMSLNGHKGVVIPLAFSPDGKKLATGGSDMTIRVWDALEGRELLTLRGHSDEIYDVNFSPDGRRLVSAGWDKSVRVWDAASGRELLTLRGNSDYYMAATFSPNGDRVACAGDFPFFEIWEGATAYQISRWREEDERVSKRWSASDEQASVRENTVRAGLVKSWLILAPLPGKSANSLLQIPREEQVSGEASLRPRAEDATRIGSQDFHWVPVQFDDGIIDFNRMTAAGEHHATSAYAVSYVKSSTARRGLRLKVGSDDLAQIFLNGQLLYDLPFSRTIAIDQDTVLGADLREGVNVVLFKAIKGHTGPWRGALRFVDEDDAPVQGLEFATSPD